MMLLCGWQWLSIIFACTIAPTASSLHSIFPHFMQCDPRWGNDTIGVVGKSAEDSTICRVGCAESSLAMLLAGLRVPTARLRPLSPLNPGTLNQWLRLDDGFDCVHVLSRIPAAPLTSECFNLVSSSVRSLTPFVTFDGYLKAPTLAALMEGLRLRDPLRATSASKAYLAHVRNATHFVLVVAVDAENSMLSVLDPFYSTTSYPFTAMSGVLAFSLHAAYSEVSYTGSPDYVPFTYPTFKQCDPRWGADLIETTTVCKVGCLMSSTSMALAGHGIDVAGRPADPGALNAWLRSHNGYNRDNDFDEAVLANVSSLLPGSVVWPRDGMHHHNDLSMSTIRRYLGAQPPRVVIANVMKGRHFVLVVGTAGEDTLLVNDPGFDRLNYSYSADVVGWRLFDMSL